MEFTFTLVLLALAFTPFVVLLVAKSPGARMEKHTKKSVAARSSAPRMAHRRTRERTARTQDGAHSVSNGCWWSDQGAGTAAAAPKLSTAQTAPASRRSSRTN